uniref:Integrase catalytic domain-containing protein n=1 Tax=Panagrolaimus davidi TaxID=227884 RepID=A0A914PDM6_9BILA
MPVEQQIELQGLLFDEPSTSIDTVLDKMKKMKMKAELVESIVQSSPSPTMPSKKQQVDSSVNSWKKDGATSGAQQKPFPCSFCDGDHKSFNCSRYATAEQRIQQLQRKRRCINCTNKDHTSNSCPKTHLKCKHCQGQHLAFLCRKTTSNTKAFVSLNKSQSSLLSTTAQVSNVYRSSVKPATLFFDSGSQRSYVTTKLAKALQLPKVNVEYLNVQGFGGKKSVYVSDLVQLRIQTINGFKDIFANTTNQIADHIPVLQKQNDAYSKMNETPDVLIGMDYFWQFITSSKQIKKDLHETQSIVGKMYSGKILFDDNTTLSSIAVNPNDPDECETFWKLEAMGIVDHQAESQEDEIVQKKFESTLRFENDRYYASWPFKSNAKPLPSNAGLSIARLRSTWIKLQQDPDLMKQYAASIDDQTQRGSTEIAPKVPQGSTVHYLSHHAVLKDQSATTKLRVVFDGSAKYSTQQQPSLNDCLYRGPIDMPEIPGLLMRMRTAKILVTGDIEKAFHQVYLNEPDRDAVRFFWMKDPQKPPEGDNIIAYRFVGVPFGVITSPSILNMVIKHHLKKQNDPKLLQLLESLYVDNIFLLEDDPDEAVRMFQLTRDCFSSASTNVREWLSNESTVMNSIPDDLKQTSMTTKLLGLEWNASMDTISIALSEKKLPMPWTKRKVLKLIASTYDPLGILAPVTIKARIFMQQLFKEKLKWDDPLPKVLNEKWKEILKSYHGSIAVSRRLIECKFPNPEDVEIHGFADASTFAYCAVIYLRIKTRDGYEVRLVLARIRLQPLNKDLTIPKMEVMGIWLTAKMIIYVAKEMNIGFSLRKIWTDSQISYYWFKQWPKEVFVANRLKEVLEAKAECLFVPGKLNPADIGTRGISIDELKNDCRWLNGPEFLKKSSDSWPKIPELGTDLTQTVIALVSICNDTETLNLQVTPIIRAYPIDEDVSWNDLLLQVARKIKDSDDVQPVDLVAAERALIIQEQEIFVKSIDSKQLKLAKDEEGIYRTHCRFDHAELLNAQPIWIPKKSSIAKLICLDVHRKLQHAGVPHTLSSIRQKYWIPSGRAIVMKCINRCPECKYWKSKPFTLPNMPQLPAARVNRSKPFENTGVDYCGPFKVAGKEEKAWIILFTCFSTRLIRLELVTTMTAEDFLLAFRKFVARCGAPKYILSDNAKQFKTTAKALDDIWKKVVKDEQSIDFYLKNGITWDFITERAPWKGGLYERLVALVKNSLKYCIGKRAIKVNEFSALLCEIEANLNSRPLTYVHANDPFVIRPADFIYPSIDLLMPTNITDDESNDTSYIPSNAAGGERLYEKYLKSLQIIDRFWNRWSHDYLNLLREKNNDEHNNARGATQRTPIPGEYVLVSEADQPRGSWKIAKIVDCLTSPDEQIRSAEIEYVDGFRTRRAINHLYPLEEAAANIDICNIVIDYPFVNCKQA